MRLVDSYSVVTSIGLRGWHGVELRDGFHGEVPRGVVAGRLLGAHLCSGVHRAHVVEGRGPLVDPHLLDVVGVHGGDPGGGVHGDDVKLVRLPAL